MTPVDVEAAVSVSGKCDPLGSTEGQSAKKRKTVNVEQPTPHPDDQMSVSTYDNVSTWVVALNIIVGFFVLLMFLVWLTSIMMFNNEPVQVKLIEPRGRGDHAKGYERDPEEPGLEEIEDMTEPRIEETFEAVTDAVSSTAASLTSMKTGATSSSHGKGLGDSRAAGEGGEGDGDVIPRWERWRIQLTARNERAFAYQLDALGIELGLFGGGDPKIYYAGNFSGTIKKYSQEGGKKEKRLYFAPNDPNAQKFTISLLRKAGYQTRGKYAVHFYPDKAENELALAEARYAKTKALDEIRRTYFAVKNQGGRLTFVVTKQEYRTVARNLAP